MLVHILGDQNVVNKYTNSKRDSVQEILLFLFKLCFPTMHLSHIQFIQSSFLRAPVTLCTTCTVFLNILCLKYLLMVYLQFCPQLNAMTPCHPHLSDPPKKFLHHLILCSSCLPPLCTLLSLSDLCFLSIYTTHLYIIAKNETQKYMMYVLSIQRISL